jgi:hypothetical protein
LNYSLDFILWIVAGMLTLNSVAVLASLL